MLPDPSAVAPASDTAGGNTNGPGDVSQVASTTTTTATTQHGPNSPTPPTPTPSSPDTPPTSSTRPVSGPLRPLSKAIDLTADSDSDNEFGDFRQQARAMAASAWRRREVRLGETRNSGSWNGFAPHYPSIQSPSIPSVDTRPQESDRHNNINGGIQRSHGPDPSGGASSETQSGGGAEKSSHSDGRSDQSGTIGGGAAGPSGVSTQEGGEIAPQASASAASVAANDDSSRGASGNGKDSDSDDFEITASTGPTRPPQPHVRRGAMLRTGQGTNWPSGAASSSASTSHPNGSPHPYNHSSPHIRSQQEQLVQPHRFHPNNSLGAASAAAHAAAAQQTLRNHPTNFAPPGAFGQPSGYTPRVAIPSVPALPGVPGIPALPGVPGIAPSRPKNANAGDGSAAAPIDIDKVYIPPFMNSRAPICIGGFMSRAIMLYPKAAVTAGEPTPAGSPELWEVVAYRGVEMLRVKLKLRKAGSVPRPDEPWSATNVDTIQVMTPGMGTYIGDVDGHTADVLIPMLKRGLCRLEGFAVRLPKETAQYECKVNVLIFTLPSNVRYIADTLLAHSLFLLDPLPPYDPARHSDHPEYHNAHGSGERAMQLYQAHRRAQHGSGGQWGNTPMDKARQVEVQRKQAEAILDELDDGVELEQSDPGPWIRTELFPHQRKALTFLLQGEQDSRSLKEARKLADKKLGKKKPSRDGSKEGTADGTDTPRELTAEERKREKEKLDFSRSLWEGERDERGRLRIWKNKVTGEKVRLKKNERPQDPKGAILADDMGLGKTLSVVSLIAATRGAANAWAEKPLEPVTPVEPENDKNSNLDASAMTTRVYGMPDPTEELVNGKKRRRDEPTESEVSRRLRRSRIKRRAKTTLLICPMSTMTNWEDQIKEHWDGKVEVVGGLGGTTKTDSKPNATAAEREADEWDTIRVYIYHGAGRNMDPRFLAEFDIVITSYSTLANEYSKQCATCGDDESTPAETGAANSDDETSRSSALGTKTPDGDSDFRPADLADALLKKGKAKKKPKVTGEQPSALQAIDWFRVVLDEAHNIKSPSTIASKASCALEADRRIALTGTPIQNRIDDVWALFKFLRMSPVDEREVFTKYITNPCKTGEQVGVARLQLVMRTCTLRRTKDSMAENGRKILDLPPRREIPVWLDLREDERAIYDERHASIKEDIMELKASKQLTKNYAHVLQHLLRLRQTCDHVDLPSSGPVEEDYDGTIMDYELAVDSIEKYGLSMPRAQSVISFMKDTPEGAVCSQCDMDLGSQFPSIGLGGAEEDTQRPPPEAEGKKGKKLPRPILSKCLHVMCPDCFRRSVFPTWPKKVAGVRRNCNDCNQVLRMDLDVMEVTPPNSDEPEDQPKKVVRRRKWKRKDGEDISLSTKMDWLRKELLRHSRIVPHSANHDFFAMDTSVKSFTDKDGNLFDSIPLDEEGNPIPTKGVIFSQWTTMLDRIEDMLIELKIGYCRLDGSMTREQRAQAMDDLRLKPLVEVMLVSTRAGGVGLNLVSACRAYLVDPYWNPSVEAQAIDRVHRMGQKHPVTAVRLMIKNSVEERLEKIQMKKASLAQLSLKNMSRKELMEQKADELASLFS